MVIDDSEAARRASGTFAGRLDEHGFRRRTITDDGRRYSPIYELLDAGHGFIILKPPSETRADRRRRRYERFVRWALESRLDVLTPAQAEALWLFYEDVLVPDGVDISYCVDDQGRSVRPAQVGESPAEVWGRANGVNAGELSFSQLPSEVRRAHDDWFERLFDERLHEDHQHLTGAIGISEAARYLGISPGAFRDRLARAERRAEGAQEYERLASAGLPIPSNLKRYARKRTRKGRAMPAPKP